jgi:DNA repair exonuclease SbcCD ATPase subunit
VNNTATIEANNKEIERLTQEGIAAKKKSEEIAVKMQEIDKKRNLTQEKSRLELKKAAINVELADGRTLYQEKKHTLEEIQKNKDAITKNGEIDAKLNVINASIQAETNAKNEFNNKNTEFEKEIARNNESIAQKKSYIIKIDEEQKIEKYWKLYLQMIGKDGISKMVLRNTLPIINCELNRLLGDVTDFKVEIVMNEKNDVDFLLFRDGKTTRLSAASGLETTQAALALRVVLGKMSKLSKPPFILLDEILGTVDKSFMDDMKRLYDKIVEEYDFVLHICHTDLDWYDDGNVITVNKKDNISYLRSE